MKLASVVKLVSAVEAKSGVAKSRLAETRRRKQALLDNAVRLESEAAAIFSAALQDAADFAAAGRRQIAMERQALACRAEAVALDPEIAERRDALKSALREEIAWRRIERRLRADAQKRRSSVEEERREAIAALSGD